MDAQAYGLERLHYGAAPSVTVTFSSHVSLPVYHGCGGRTRDEDRRADSVSQMQQHELKGPSRLGPS